MDFFAIPIAVLIRGLAVNVELIADNSDSGFATGCSRGTHRQRKEKGNHAEPRRALHTRENSRFLCRCQSKDELRLPQCDACALVVLVRANVIKLSSPATREFWEIPILFEDDHLLALNKPPRLLSSPDRYDPNRPNLMKLLHRDIERAAPWARQRGLIYLMNAHRLDFETGGVILLAKSKPVLLALGNLFGTEKPQKIYVALAHGNPGRQGFSVDAKLAPHPTKPGVARVDENHGRKSKTLFEVRERFDRYVLLECRPLTRRTHLIRVHSKKAGFPIVGHMTYGGRELLLSSLNPAIG